MKLGIVGATGMVGRMMLNVLQNRKIHIDNLYLSASNKSIGKQLLFNNKKYHIITINELFKHKPNVVLFSAGSKISYKWANKFSDIGVVVIDNSSAWRLHPNIKLIVPEINSTIISKNDKIISNPNCSTIQLVMVLFPLHKKYKIKRIVISTYQSVTGTGKKAVNQLENENKNTKIYEKIYPHKIYQNVLPHCDDFQNNGYTLEEMKLIKETKKIMSDDSISITSTSARVPVIGGHSESVNITFYNKPNINVIYKILKNSKGIIVQDDPKNNIYPMPINAQDKDDVFVGRIRKDFSCKNSINLWIVSDNLRKGASTNAIQILEYLKYKKYV